VQVPPSSFFADYQYFTEQSNTFPLDFIWTCYPMATPVQDAWYDFLPTCSEMGKLTKGEQDRLFGLLKDKVAITPNALAKDESDWNDTLKEVGITSSQDRGVIKVGLRKLQDKTGIYF
jgi:hypothetical protein